MRYELKERLIRVSAVLTEPVTFDIPDDEAIAYIVHTSNYGGIGPTAIIATIKRVEDDNDKPA